MAKISPWEQGLQPSHGPTIYSIKVYSVPCKLRMWLFKPCGIPWKKLSVMTSPLDIQITYTGGIAFQGDIFVDATRPGKVQTIFSEY